MPSEFDEMKARRAQRSLIDQAYYAVHAMTEKQRVELSDRFSQYNNCSELSREHFGWEMSKHDQ